MSGTLKLTKLKSEFTEGDLCIYSNVKPHLSLSTELLEKAPDDTDFALERLLQLSSIPPKVIGNILIERGITDFIESWTSREQGSAYRESEDFIKSWTTKETEFLGDKVVRELLVMKDKEFIRDSVLVEPSRSRLYPDLETYLRRQDEYVKFTLQHNSVDFITEILNAEKFIKTL